MPISNYPHGFRNGVSIKENPMDLRLSPTANVFWVDSVHGSDGNPGNSARPFATIDYAVGRCTADNGDVIYVAAGHVETVTEAAGLALDVSGITIVFMGEGDERAYVTFTTAVTADMDVDADDITLINPRFVAGIDALTGPVDINKTNFKIINGQWEDGASIDTTDCVVADANATGLQIRGWRYVVGDEGGTQKQSNIQLNGVDNAILSDIDIFGDFATGNIENVTDETLNIRLENIELKNTNSGPKPGIVLDADATGQAKNLDIRIASGTTYISNLAKLNYDADCLGYNADGTTGDPIGTAPSTGLEGKVDAIQADLGDPSSRTNFQNIEDMIGIPDAANSCVDDMLRTGFDSSAITSNADGSVMERLEHLQSAIIPDLSGLAFGGACDSGMTGSTTTIVSANLAGYGDDYFNTKYYMQIIKNANSVGNAPEREVRQITDYVSATGTFTVTAFTGNVEETDSVLVLHESFITLGRDDADNTIATTNVVANEDGSILERLEQIQEAVNIGSGTSLAANKSLADAMGTNGTTVTDSAVSVLGAIGADNNNNAFASTSVVSNADGSVLERLEYLQNSIVPDMGGFIFSGTCDTGMTGSTTAIVCAQLAGYQDDFFNSKYYMQVIRNANSVGNAPEFQIRLITDYVSATGTFTTNAFGANVEEGDAILVMHESYVMLGRDDTDNIADTSNVVANADGSILERQESIQASAGLDVDSATTDNLHGKLGTDTELADRSMFDLLGGDGFAAYPAAAAPGNDVSLAEVARAIYDDTDTISGAALPAAPTANSLAAFVASGGTALGTELADSKSLIDAIGSDGTTLSYGSGSALGAVGTVHVVTKQLISSNIPQDGVSTVDVTAASSGGDLIIEEVTMNTDGTGLAAGTNFQLEISGNSYGVTGAIMAETVANLGANATVGGTSASVTPLSGAVLETGAKIVACSTVAACTGAGVIELQIKFRRVSAGATVAAA